MKLDVLAIGAHPDDADLGVGGLLCKYAQAGRAVGILDLSAGELGSRGSAGERAAEAGEAAKRLGVATRRNAGLPDGGLSNTPEQREAVIRAIRALRPALLLAPMAPDRHPDHAAAHALVRDAHFFAGVAGLDTGQPPWRPRRIYYYHAYYEPNFPPSVLVDISDVFERKRTALRAFASQFYNPAYSGPETHVASKAFWEAVETRAAYWGGRAGVRYAEPLHALAPPGVAWPPNAAPDELTGDPT